VLAAYRGIRGIEVSRRPAAGSWSAPAVLTSVAGASERAVAVSDSGTGAVMFVQSGGDPRVGGRVSLRSATVGPAMAPVVEQVNAAGFDADMSFDASGLDIDDAGNLAVAFNRSDGLLGHGIAQLAYRPAPGPFATAGTLTAQQAAAHAYGDGGDVAFAATGELLTTWTDHYPKQDRLTARWVSAPRSARRSRWTSPRPATSSSDRSRRAAHDTTPSQARPAWPHPRRPALPEHRSPPLHRHADRISRHDRARRDVRRHQRPDRRQDLSSQARSAAMRRFDETCAAQLPADAAPCRATAGPRAWP
jgi:hypothetical protein